MWRRPTASVRQDALRLLRGAQLKDPPVEIWDVECDRIFFVSQSGKAGVANLHFSGDSRLVRSIHPGWPV